MIKILCEMITSHSHMVFLTDWHTEIRQSNSRAVREFTVERSNEGAGG